MTTKTTKTTTRKPRASQAAPVPESAPESTTAAPASPTTPVDSLLSADDRAGAFDVLASDQRELAGTLADVLFRQQQRDQEAEWRAKYEQERQRKLKEARRMAKSHALDEVERISLHLIGELAMSFDLTRDSLYDGALEGLFRTINQTLRSGLAQADEYDLGVIIEAERAGVSTQSPLANDDDDDESEGDDGEE